MLMERWAQQCDLLNDKSHIDWKIALVCCVDDYLRIFLFLCMDRLHKHDIQAETDCDKCPSSVFHPDRKSNQSLVKFIIFSRSTNYHLSWFKLSIRDYWWFSGDEFFVTPCFLYLPKPIKNLAWRGKIFDWMCPGLHPARSSIIEKPSLIHFHLDFSSVFVDCRHQSEPENVRIRCRSTC